MEIRHLKLVKEVAEKGSLTKAMDNLFLSQSALSHQLKEIETQLGASLFHRVNKKLILTGAGKIVLESAERILKELEKAERAVKKYAGGDEGVIKITTECYTCYHWLPSLMVEFNKEFPNVEIEIFPELMHDTLKLVLEGDVDLAIISAGIDNPDFKPTENPNLKATELFTDELMVLVNFQHPWVKKKFIKPKDFTDQNVIIHSLPLESVGIFKQLLIPEGVKVRKVIPIQITEAAVEMVKAGMGVRVMSRWMLAPYLADKRLAAVPITRQGLFRKWYALTLNKPDSPQYLMNFTEHMRCNIAGICTPKH